MVVGSPHGDDGLKDAGSAHRMAKIPLQAIDGDGRETGPVDGYRLHLVVEHGGSAVGIHHGQRRRVGIMKHGLESEQGSIAFLRRGADVVGIVSDVPCGDAPVVGLRRTAAKDHSGCRLAQIQTSSLDVEGSACVGRECLQRLETGDDEWTLTVGSADDGIVVSGDVKKSRGKNQG